MFRAIWPLTAPHRSFAGLTRDAAEDLPLLAAQAHARIRGAGRWYVAPASTIPGAGNGSRDVLVFEAPAVRVGARAWRKGVAA